MIRCLLTAAYGASVASDRAGPTFVDIVTGVGVAVAIIALIMDGRRTRLSLGLNNLWKLIEQWDHEDMRRRRAAVAASLLAAPTHRQGISDEGIDVLNTFELLSFLVRARTLRLRDAWVNFSMWAIGWWYVYEPAIRTMQERDRTVFEDYDWLVRRFVKYDAKRRRLDISRVTPNENELRQFLEAERDLPTRLATGPPERRATLWDVIRGWLGRPGPPGKPTREAGEASV